MQSRELVHSVKKYLRLTTKRGQVERAVLYQKEHLLLNLLFHNTYGAGFSLVAWIGGFKHSEAPKTALSGMKRRICRHQPECFHQAPRPEPLRPCARKACIHAGMLGLMVRLPHDGDTITEGEIHWNDVIGF